MANEGGIDWNQYQLPKFTNKNEELRWKAYAKKYGKDYNTGKALRKKSAPGLGVVKPGKPGKARSNVDIDSLLRVGGVKPKYPTLEENIQKTADMRAAGLLRDEQQPTMGGLYEQLQAQLAGIKPQYTPLELLQTQANQQANAQFDPAILALQGEMGRAEKRGKQSQAEARDMYGALSRTIASELPQITAQMNAAENETTSRYEGAKKQLQSQYAQQAKEQQAIVNQLGVQAATQGPGNINQQLQGDQAYFQQMASQDQNQALNALAQIEAGATNYNRQSAGLAGLAGENTAQDIGRQLTDYLGGAGDKLAGLRGQKASTAAQLLAQLQQADQQRGQDLYNQQFNQAMDMNRFNLDVMNAQNQSSRADDDLMFRLFELQNKMSQQGQGGGGYTSGLTGASNFLAQMYPGETDKATQLQGILNSVLASPEVKSGRQNITGPLGNQVQTGITNETVMDMLRQLAGQQGVTNSRDLNSLIDAYLAYKGQLRGGQ